MSVSRSKRWNTFLFCIYVFKCKIIIHLIWILFIYMLHWWYVLKQISFSSLNCCMSTLHLVHYALLLTPACFTNARLMASAPSLALDPTFGIHSHKTFDTAQPCHLLKPNWKPSSSHRISILTDISTQFLLQSLCVCVCVCVCMRRAFFSFCIILYVNCFGRTMLYMCIEYHI